MTYTIKIQPTNDGILLDHNPMPLALGNRKPKNTWQPWQEIQREAEVLIQQEPAIRQMVEETILNHDSISGAIAFRLASKLAGPDATAETLFSAFASAFDMDPDLEKFVLLDILAVKERDPACNNLLQPIIFFKGFLALQAHRIAHSFWTNGRCDLARFIQAQVSENFTVDIHPAARIGHGVMLDHAHSVVIGETAVIGDNASILHSVTLGGTGKEEKDRHPKVGDDVTIGAGATILGNIKIGDQAKVAAGSVVLKGVSAAETVAGVPAKPMYRVQDLIAGALSG